MKIKALKIALFISGCLACHASQAAVLLAGELTHNYNLQPGATITGHLELRNNGNTPEEVKLYQEDIRIGANGKPEYTQGGHQHERSNTEWINLPTDRIILNPGAKQTIAYTLQVPNNGALNGSYWSSLVVEPISKNSQESQQKQQAASNTPDISIHQRVRYAVQVISTIGNQAAANLEFSQPKVTTTQAGKYLQVGIHNTGNQFSRPKVWLDVFDKQGKDLGRFEAQPHGLFVGERDLFQVSLNKLAPGQYKALLAAQDNTQGQIFGSDIALNIQN